MASTCNVFEHVCAVLRQAWDESIIAIVPPDCHMDAYKLIVKCNNGVVSIESKNIGRIDFNDGIGIVLLTQGITVIYGFMRDKCEIIKSIKVSNISFENIDGYPCIGSEVLIAYRDNIVCIYEIEANRKRILFMKCKEDNIYRQVVDVRKCDIQRCKDINFGSVEKILNHVGLTLKGLSGYEYLLGCTGFVGNCCGKESISLLGYVVAYMLTRYEDNTGYSYALFDVSKHNKGFYGIRKRCRKDSEEAKIFKPLCEYLSYRIK